MLPQDSNESRDDIVPDIEQQVIDEANALEQTLRALDSLDEKSKLVEIWKVLEVLTVSLDRLGTYWLFNGEDAAKDAIHKFMNPSLVRKIANARYLIVSVLEAHYSGIEDELEELSEAEGQLDYWNGP